MSGLSPVVMLGLASSGLLTAVVGIYLSSREPTEPEDPEQP